MNEQDKVLTTQERMREALERIRDWERDSQAEDCPELRAIARQALSPDSQGRCPTCGSAEDG